MSDTHGATNAKQRRELLKVWVDNFNSGDSAENNKLMKEIRDLQTDGVRLHYGNKRKAVAQTKVLKRRAERKQLNKIDEVYDE